MNRISERVSRKKKSELTLARFEGGAVNGVPSRFSVTLCFATVSSLSGRMFRSAYFLQLMPQLSQSMLVARPFGAFHHVSDSLVRQAPQLIWDFVNSVMIEPSSSSGSRDGGLSGTDFPDRRAALMCSFSVPSLALST